MAWRRFCVASLTWPLANSTDTSSSTGSRPELWISMAPSRGRASTEGRPDTSLAACSADSAAAAGAWAWPALASCCINAGLATETPSCTICDSISSIFSAVRRAISRALNPLVDSGDGAASLLFRFFFLLKKEKNPTDVCPLTGSFFSVAPAAVPTTPPAPRQSGQSIQPAGTPVTEPFKHRQSAAPDRPSSQTPQEKRGRLPPFSAKVCQRHHAVGLCATG